MESNVKFTAEEALDFHARGRPGKIEIVATKPDLVGLQEVALWRKQAPSDGGAPPISPLPGATPATAVEQDFLALLRRQLKRVGAKYRVVAVPEGFGTGVPRAGGAPDRPHRHRPKQKGDQTADEQADDDVRISADERGSEDEQEHDCAANEQT